MKNESVVTVRFNSDKDYWEIWIDTDSTVFTNKRKPTEKGIRRLYESLGAGTHFRIEWLLNDEVHG